MRTICVVTGSRAEFGLLRPLLDVIAAQPDLALRLVVTGSHLSARHGMTRDEIVAAGYPIAAEVDIQLSDTAPNAVAHSMGLGLMGMADAFTRLHPDIVVLLGDRFEILAAANAAAVLNLPIAHLHGGETSEGALDELFRHAITKLAQLHFVAAEPYARRVVQMGEHPSRVFQVGALSADAILRTHRLDRVAVEQALGLPLRQRLLLVTYHPETATGLDPAAAVAELTAALEQTGDATIVITGVNADPHGDAAAAGLAAFAAAHGDRAVMRASLGQRLYLSAMAQADAVIGNSSSGIVEAPVMRVPTVNIGARQQGRLRTSSIIDCATERGAIATAIAHALAPGFRAAIAAMPHPYGDGRASQRIVAELRRADLAGLRAKAFYDLPPAATP